MLIIDDILVIHVRYLHLSGLLDMISRKSKQLLASSSRTLPRLLLLLLTICCLLLKLVRALICLLHDGVAVAISAVAEGHRASIRAIRCRMSGGMVTITRIFNCGIGFEEGYVFDFRALSIW